MLWDSFILDIANVIFCTVMDGTRNIQVETILTQVPSAMTSSIRICIYSIKKIKRFFGAINSSHGGKVKLHERGTDKLAWFNAQVLTFVEPTAFINSVALRVQVYLYGMASRSSVSSCPLASLNSARTRHAFT